MALSDHAERLAEYRARLEDGRADRIEPAHVERVIAKLRAKQASLLARLATASAQGERERLQRKLAKAEALIEQACWLREQL